MKKHKRGHKNKSVLKLLRSSMGAILVIAFNIAALVYQGGVESGLVATSDKISEQVAVEEVKEEKVKNFVLTVDSDLTIPSNISAKEAEKMLENYPKLHGLGAAFVKAEKKKGVNALYMLGLACLESNYGRSNFAVERNNLYGWCAYDSNPRKSKLF